MTRRDAMLVLVAALAAGVATFAAGSLDPVAAAVAGALLVGCGVGGWRVRPSSRIGPLLCLAGVAWVAGGLAPGLVVVHRVPLVYAIVSYPSGRLHRWPGRVAVACTVAAAVVPALARRDAFTLVTAGLVAVSGIDSLIHTGGPRRRGVALALGAGITYSMVLLLASLTRLGGWEFVEAMRLAYDVVVAAIAVVLFGGLLAGGWTHAVIADLVVDLGEISDTGTLRQRLAAAVGDPTLVLGYWIEGEGGYVDDVGTPVMPSSPGSGRSTTRIEDDGKPLAVLVYDDAVADDPRLVTSVVAAVRIAVSNARMYADVRARVAQLTASRRRIVEAADAERRKLSHSLDDGPGRRLEMVASLLAEVAADAVPAATEIAPVQHALGDALEELRRFAAGVRPATLTEGGLATALPVLAERCPLPVDLSVSVGRLAPAVEGALYFACAEALANVAKHSSAARASIRIESTGGAATASINDDGAGGASIDGGSGLRGLRDRIEALGGSIRVDSPASAGTRITISLPRRTPDASTVATDRGGVLIAATGAR